MKTKDMAERLAALCGRVKLETPAGRILVPSVPLDLLETLSDLLDGPERDDALWNGFAHVAGQAWEPLVRFEWEERTDGLSLLHLGEASFIALPLAPDGTAEQVIARVEPAASSDLVGELLLDAALSNGLEYGFDLFRFHGLPARVIDHVGVAPATWREVYWRWLDVAGGDEGWTRLLDRLRGTKGGGRRADLKRELIDQLIEVTYEAETE